MVEEGPIEGPPAGRTGVVGLVDVVDLPVQADPDADALTCPSNWRVVSPP